VRMFRRQLGLTAALCMGLIVATGGSASERRGSYELALELLEQGVVFEAIHELELFVEGHPDHEMARLQLARSLHRVKRERRTAEEAAHVLRINPDNAEARRLLTRIRIKLGRELDRADPVAVLDYARLCSRPETYDRAADFYRLYLELDDDPLVHMEFAKMLYWAERYIDAKRHLETYLLSKPDDMEMRCLLGRICGAMADFDEAVEQYRRCLSVRPDEIDIQLELARALMWNGQEEEAQALLNKIRERSAEYDTPLLLLASIARVQGRIQEEYDLYRAVLEKRPENEIARARVEALETGSMLAVAVCQNQLLEAPEDAVTRRRLVDIYLSEERYGEAIPHLEELNAQNPGDLESVAELRLAREEEGRRAMAAVLAFHDSEKAARTREIEQIQAWVVGNPNDYKSRSRLADLMLESMDYAAAVEQLEILELMALTDGRITEKLQRARALMHAGVDAGPTSDK
jgi:tetratricopeptide (TPR) repeat protein